MASPRLSVVWIVVWWWWCTSSTLAQETPALGFLGDPCIGYRGVDGTCTLVNCPALQHDLVSLPLPEFVSRHGASCDIDLIGNKLVCCPSKPTDLSSESCGRSTLAEHQRGGVADRGAWPWLAVLYLPDDIIGWTPVGCHGALISDRHVLVPSDCTLHQEIHVVLGEYRMFNFTGVQNITSLVAVRSVHWQKGYQDLAILVLEEPAVLIPDVIWPVCISQDPLTDLGYPLDGLHIGEKQLGFLPFWPGLNQDIGTIPLHQSQAFLSNCSAFCDKNLDPNAFCPYYNVTKGPRNPVCVGGMSVAECRSQISRDGQPVVVQSAISREFYLAGLTRTSVCHSPGLNNLLIPVTPTARDILRIIK